NTKLSLSLLMGLLNVRLGYWWGRRIRARQRPGRYPPGMWRRLRELPRLRFRTERMLLDEWRAYYGGPSQRYWYLSDGGHFEGTGMYELIRRPMPLIIPIAAPPDTRSPPHPVHRGCRGAAGLALPVPGCCAAHSAGGDRLRRPLPVARPGGGAPQP